MEEPKKKKKGGKHQPKGLLILHEDRDILVVDKAPGLLTMGTDREKEETAYFRITDYVKKGNPKAPQRVYIVHRLDREVSGILVFAKTPEAKNALQSDWENSEKRYYALVHGIPREPEGTFSSYLIENGVHSVHATADKKKGKLSHTDYTLLGSAHGVSLLEINLLTGRKHQIRVHPDRGGYQVRREEDRGQAPGAPREVDPLQPPLQREALLLRDAHPPHVFPLF